MSQRDMFTYTICIDSQHRDAALYPSPHDYIVDLEEVLKNVQRIELVTAIYTKANTESDAYVVLHIRDVQSHTISNSMHLRESFTTLPLVQAGTNMYHRTMFTSAATFDPPLLKLSKMSIRFLKPNGEPYPMADHFLRFEVSTLSHSQIMEWTPPESGREESLRMLGLDAGGRRYTDEELSSAFKRQYREWKRGGGSGGKTDPYYIALKQALKRAMGHGKPFSDA